MIPLVETYPISPKSREEPIQFPSKERLTKFLEENKVMQRFRYSFNQEAIEAIASEYGGKQFKLNDLEADVGLTIALLYFEKKLKFSGFIPLENEAELNIKIVTKALLESVTPWEKFKEFAGKALEKVGEEMERMESMTNSFFMGINNRPSDRHTHIPVPDSLHHNFFSEEQLLNGLKKDPRTASLNPKLLNLIAECLGGEERVNDDFLKVFAKKALEKVLSPEELKSIQEEKVIEDIREVLRDNAHSHCDAVPNPDAIQTAVNYIDSDRDFLTAEERKEDSFLRELESKKLLPPERVVAELDQLIETHEAKAEVVKHVAESPSKGAEVATEAMRVAAHIAHEIYDLIQKNDQRKIERSRYNGLYKDYIRSRKRQDRDLKNEEVRQTSANLEHIRLHLFQRFSPKGIVELYEEARILSEKYKAELVEIESDLKTNAAIQDSISQVQSLNDALAASDHKRWKAALRRQQRLGQEFGLLRAIMGIAGVTVGAAATLVPGGQAPGLAMAAQGLNVFASGAQLGERGADRKSAKINANYQRKVDATSLRSEELFETASIAREQAFQLQRRQFQNQEVLLMYGSVFDTKTYTKSLKDSEELQRHNLEAAQAKLENAQTQVAHYSNAAIADEGRIKKATEEQEKVDKEHKKKVAKQSTGNGFYVPPKIKKKTVKVDGCKKEELESNRLDNLTKAANASVEAEAHKREIAILSESLEATRKESSYQMSIQPYRKLQEEIYKQKGYIKYDENGNRVSTLSPEEKVAKEKREAFSDTIQKVVEAEELDHRLENEGLRVAQQYAYFLQTCGWNAPMQAVSAAHDAHELRKSHAVWGQIKKAVDTFKEDHKKESYRETITALHAATPGEASNAVKLALLSAEHLLVGFRLALTLSSLLQSTWRILNGRSGPKSERELLLRHLQESFQFLHHVLSAQMDSLGDQIDHSTRETCMAIYNQGEEIIREIDSGKSEILSKVEGSAYNVQLQKQLKLLNKLKPTSEGLQAVFASENAGILPGFSPHQEGIVLYPAVEPKAAYRNPEHFPELLFSRFGLQDNIPNIALLIAFAEQANQNNCERNHLETLKAAHIRIEKAIERIGNAFDEMAARREAYFKTVSEERHKVQILKSKVSQTIGNEKKSFPQPERTIVRTNPGSHLAATAATGLIARYTFSLFKEIFSSSPLAVTLVASTPIIMMAAANYGLVQSVTDGIILHGDKKQWQAWKVDAIKNRHHSLVSESPKNGARPLLSLQNNNPLALPDKLLKTTDELLDQELHLLENLGMGTLIPKYSFSERGGEWHLQLHYQFISTQGSTTPFCHFDLASFSSNELKGSNSYAFLLEKLYSPKGLYDEGLDSSLNVQIDQGYPKIMHDSTVASKALAKQAIAYNEGYYVLYGLAKMISNISNEEFFTSMERCGLPHSDLLIQHVLAGTTPNMSEAPFTRALLDNPSNLLQRLRKSIETLKI